MNKLKSKAWWEAAGTRAIRTFAHTALAAVPVTGLALHEVNWVITGSIAVTATILSLLTSLAGLPEVEEV